MAYSDPDPLGKIAMSGNVDVSAVNSAVDKAERLIARQRAVILARTAGGKPIEALSPVLNQIEGNLRLLSKVQRFVEGRQRRTLER